MKQPYNTALYMRLSRDDENYVDSVSIETQRTILQQYAKEQELHVVGEYIDDGWSGTMFERPNFKRGQEKGYFQFGGSTVVVLVEKDKIIIDEDIMENSRQNIETIVKFGEKVAVRK